MIYVRLTNGEIFVGEEVDSNSFVNCTFSHGLKLEELTLKNKAILYKGEITKEQSDILLRNHNPNPIEVPVENIKLKEDEVKWIVNIQGELGVRIGTKNFYLYKGESTVYETAINQPWRLVEKREFGETCKPLNFKEFKDTIQLYDWNED